MTDEQRLEILDKEQVMNYKEEDEEEEEKKADEEEEINNEDLVNEDPKDENK